MITEVLKVKPNVLCGHSLGEYSALTCANSIPIFNALRLVHNRGLLMERARKGSMYAVLNFDLKKISLPKSFLHSIKINEPLVAL